MNAVRSEIAVNEGKIERKVQKIGLNRSQASQNRDKFITKHTTVTMNMIAMLPPSSTRNGDQTVEIWELQLRPKRGCFAKLPEPNFLNFAHQDLGTAFFSLVFRLLAKFHVSSI